MLRNYWETIKIGFRKRTAITIAVVLPFTIAQVPSIPLIVRNLSFVSFLFALFPYSFFCLPSFISNIRFTIEMVLKAKQDVPIPDEFQSLAGQFGIKLQEMKIIDGIFNAGATAHGKIILGTLLLKNFNLDQQKAVIAHELAHIKRRHHTKLIIFLMVILPYIFIVSSHLPQTVSCLVSLAMLTYFLMPVQWFTEFDADKYAARIIGVDNMISALEAFPGDPNEGSEDHPPISIRIKRLKDLSTSA